MIIEDGTIFTIVWNAWNVKILISWKSLILDYTDRAVRIWELSPLFIVECSAAKRLHFHPSLHFLFPISTFLVLPILQKAEEVGHVHVILQEPLK